MKCKVCGGTGTSNTCVNGTFKPCSFCDGTGKYEPFDADVELDKLYPTEQTNEEWFCGLSTEEKAEWLSKHFHCGDCIFEKPMCGGEYGGCKSAFVEWLKEIHDGNMG